jgi:hypothetical protein
LITVLVYAPWNVASQDIEEDCLSNVVGIMSRHDAVSLCEYCASIKSLHTSWVAKLGIFN